MRRIAATAIVAALFALTLQGIAIGTPGVGVSGEFLATGTVADHFTITARGTATDVKVQQLTIAPGGTTGWHTHAGPVIVVVREGTFTVREAHGRHCATRQYGPGEAFVDPGHGHVHRGDNLTSAPVLLTATYLLPAGGTARIDADAPKACAGQ
jgi:quercetin dioxygenase-like cupin family protein